MRGVLYLQSEYSLLNSLIKLEDMFIHAKEHQYDFLALTDDTLYGLHDFFNFANKYQIKPILGLTLEVVSPNYTKFLIYVKNEKGYKNLLKINMLKEQNHKFSLEELIHYQNGLIFVTAGFESIIDQTILFGNELEVNTFINRYLSLFDNFYVGIATNYEIQKKISTPYLLKLKEELNFKVLPIHQSNYLKEDDKFIYESLVKIANQNKILDKDSTFKILTKDELEKINNYDLKEFVNSISFNLTYPTFSMPDYLEENQEDYLINLAKKGLSRRLEINNIKDKRKYHERLDYELEVIISKGFTNYFLIVFDFVRYAKQNNVLVGPGRGSAAGSLVSYSLGITEVDPIKYNLLFERFLNVERMSMPDIDIDFPDNKRDFVIEYVRNKYGDNHIASITTFDRFQTKSSIRDISRVLNIPPHRVSGIIAAVERNVVDKTDVLVNKLLTIAKNIEGMIRHTGTHPAGIILAKQDLTEFLPMNTGAFKFNQLAMDMNQLESIGLYKIDFLGIRNLSIISDIISDLKVRNVKIDLNNLPLDDKKTYQLLSSGNTTGIFQLESSGMRRVLEKLKPTNFEDVVATLALFRPGPMANIDVYIARKNGAKFNYLHEDLKEILEPTYGIIIYQEQIMQIAVKFAGLTYLEADNLRVGISKKDKTILEEEKLRFVKGAISKGYSEKLANEIYELILKFALYGFNRSHSVSYSLVAYQMAYLKANYFIFFMKSLLNYAIGNRDQTGEYIRELKQQNIDVLIPNINYSGNLYLIRDGKLLMPLTQIKGIGQKVYEAINLERKNGPFESYNDLKKRLSSIINEQQLISLINAGALDDFNYNRKTMNENLDLTQSHATKFIRDFVIRESKEYDLVTLRENELNALGLNVKYSFKEYVESLKIQNLVLVSEIKSIKNPTIDIAGIISSIKEHKTKAGDKMLFITLTDLVSKIDITIFPNSINLFRDYQVNDQVIIKVNQNLFRGKQTYSLINIKSLGN